MARKNRVFASRRVEPEASALIISRSDTAGADKNFKRIACNGGPPSNWSTLSGLGFTIADGSQGEIKVGIVQTTAKGAGQNSSFPLFRSPTRLPVQPVRIRRW